MKGVRKGVNPKVNRSTCQIQAKTKWTKNNVCHIKTHIRHICSFYICARTKFQYTKYVHRWNVFNAIGVRVIM